MKKDFAEDIPKLYQAYQNLEFLESDDGRIVRFLCDYLEPLSRFRKEKVSRTIVFFGSARIKDEKEAKADLAEVKKLVEASPDDAELKKKLEWSEKQVVMSKYYHEAEELAYRLAKWSAQFPEEQKFLICTGGGPGIMKAANQGAHRAGERNIGLNISIPHEQTPNLYATKELQFEFRYFLVRKFWFLYLSRAMLIFPGGVGTLDEMFELLTLIQTGKNRYNIPIILYGNEFWSKVINLDAMVEYGTISPEDLKLVKVVNTVDEAFEFITNEMDTRFVSPPANEPPEPF